MARAPHSAAFHFLNPRLEAFLFASIGEEADTGMPLSVASALARIGIDPWQEAARLSEMPKQAAARRLDGLIARLIPRGRDVADAGTIAARLVELLPRDVPAMRRGVAGRGVKARPPTIPLLVVLLVVAAVLFGLAVS